MNVNYRTQCHCCRSAEPLLRVNTNVPSKGPGLIQSPVGSPFAELGTLPDAELASEFLLDQSCRRSSVAALPGPRAGPRVIPVELAAAKDPVEAPDSPNSSSSRKNSITRKITKALRKSLSTRPKDRSSQKSSSPTPSAPTSISWREPDSNIEFVQAAELEDTSSSSGNIHDVSNSSQIANRINAQVAYVSKTGSNGPNGEGYSTPSVPNDRSVVATEPVTDPDDAPQPGVSRSSTLSTFLTDDSGDTVGTVDTLLTEVSAVSSVEAFDKDINKDEGRSVPPVENDLDADWTNTNTGVGLNPIEDVCADFLVQFPDIDQAWTEPHAESFPQVLNRNVSGPSQIASNNAQVNYLPEYGVISSNEEAQSSTSTSSTQIIGMSENVSDYNEAPQQGVSRSSTLSTFLTDDTGDTMEAESPISPVEALGPEIDDEEIRLLSPVDYEAEVSLQDWPNVVTDVALNQRDGTGVNFFGLLPDVGKKTVDEFYFGSFRSGLDNYDFDTADFGGTEAWLGPMVFPQSLPGLMQVPKTAVVDPSPPQILQYRGGNGPASPLAYRPLCGEINQVDVTCFNATRMSQSIPPRLRPLKPKSGKPGPVDVLDAASTRASEEPDGLIRTRQSSKKRK